MAKVNRKDFLEVAKKKIHRPADLPPNFSFLIYGRNKRGKSTFGVSGGIEKTLVIDPEAGTKAMVNANPYVWPMERWADLDEIYGALRTGQLSPAVLGGDSDEPFSIVNLDGVTKINNICLKHVMKVQEDRDLDRQPGFVQQRDYGKSGELMKEMFQKFQTLPMVKIYTAQERMIVGNETFSSGEEDDDADDEDNDITWVPDLPKGVRADLEGQVDVIGRITAQKVEVKGKTKLQRRLYIGVHEGLDTGFRSDFDLPSVIKYPKIPKLIKLMSEGTIK